jgi:ribosomal protein S1
LELAIGDRIEATVVDDGRASGSIVLKKTLGRGAHLAGELEQALEHRIAVEGVVTGENKLGHRRHHSRLSALGSWLSARCCQLPAVYLR